VPAHVSIQNDAAILCCHNGLDCLPAPKCTNGRTSVFCCTVSPGSSARFSPLTPATHTRAFVLLGAWGFPSGAVRAPAAPGCASRSDKKEAPIRHDGAGVDPRDGLNCTVVEGRSFTCSIERRLADVDDLALSLGCRSHACLVGLRNGPRQCGLAVSVGHDRSSTALFPSHAADARR
jgi:hypothetical protein